MGGVITWRGGPGRWNVHSYIYIYVYVYISIYHISLLILVIISISVQYIDVSIYIYSWGVHESMIHDDCPFLNYNSTTMSKITHSSFKIWVFPKIGVPQNG